METIRLLSPFVKFINQGSDEEALSKFIREMYIEWLGNDKAVGDVEVYRSLAKEILKFKSKNGQKW